MPHPWPGIALTLSAVGTAVPIVFMTKVGRSESDAGLVLGILATEIVTPSAGHLYGGLPRRAMKGMVARGVGYGLLATGAAGQGLWPGQTESSEFTYSIFVMGIGAGIMAGSALVDIIAAPADVDRKNAEWLGQHGSIGLYPLSDGSPALAASLRF